MHTKQPYPNSLRLYRKQAGLRQADVARSLELDCTDRISRWENGAAVPHLINLFRLSILYKTTPQTLYPEMWQAIENPNSVPSSEEEKSCHCEFHTLPK
jgi:transcriptional regulator with XRE-family HTH domain